MKLVDLSCPHCGAKLQVNGELKEATCNYCGQKFLVDDEVHHIQYENVEQAGYDFEKGRQRAKAEQQAAMNAQTVDTQPTVDTVTPQKKGGMGTCWKVLLWIFFFPIMLSIWIWKTDKIKDKRIKIGLIVAFWVIGIAINATNEKNKTTGTTTATTEATTEASTEATTESSDESATETTSLDEWPTVKALGLDDDTMISIYKEIETGYAGSPSYSIEGELTEEDLAADDAYAEQVLQEVGEKYSITADDADDVHGYVLMNYDELLAKKGADIANLTLDHSELLEVNTFAGNIIIKAKVSKNLLNDKMIRNSCYFEVYEAIQDYKLQYYNNLSYWAVADMTNGTEQKVISFEVSQEVMEMVANETIYENQLVDYLTDLWISPVLQD